MEDAFLKLPFKVRSAHLGYEDKYGHYGEIGEFGAVVYSKNKTPSKYDMKNLAKDLKRCIEKGIR